MSKSYDRNIERLKANQAFVSQSEQDVTTETARLRGQEGKERAALWGKLTPFSDDDLPSRRRRFHTR